MLPDFPGNISIKGSSHLSSNTQYTCNEYREEMLLLGLQRQLHAENVSEEERERLKERIKDLEASMDMT